MRVGIWVMLVSVLLLGASAWGSKDLEPGVARFGLSLLFLDPPSLGRESRVLVSSGSTGHGKGSVAEVHISVPQGIDLVSGDTLRHPHVSLRDPKSGDRKWEIVLRTTRVGHYVIRGYIRIPRNRPDAWDEKDLLVELDVRADTAIVAGARSTFTRRIDGAQRFRYGGRHMVLLDSGDAGDHGVITEEPVVLDRPPGKCGSCGLTEPKVIKLAVTVGRSGGVTWIEPRGRGVGEGDDASVLAAAEAAVRQWRFKPARAADGQSVAQWAVVDVLVEPQGR